MNSGTMQGRKKRELLDEFHASGRITVPVGTVYGANEGPTLSVIAGIHGTEYCGIEAAIRLFVTCDPEAISGTLVVIPVANIPGFLERTPSVCPVDGKDINRVFPGKPTGSYSEVVASLLFERFIRGADCLVSLHGGHAFQIMGPCAILSETGDNEIDDACYALAEAYDVPYVLKGVDRHQRTLGDMLLPGAASKVGIPAIQTDAGGQGIIDESSVEVHTRGLMNILKHMGMMEGAPEITREPVYFSTLLRLRARQEGLFHPQVELGERVNREQRLGIVVDFFGEALEEIRSPVEGIVLALTTSPAITRDGILFGIGTDEFT